MVAVTKNQLEELQKFMGALAPQTPVEDVTEPPASTTPNVNLGNLPSTQPATPVPAAQPVQQPVQQPPQQPAQPQQPQVREATPDELQGLLQLEQQSRPASDIELAQLRDFVRTEKADSFIESQKKAKERAGLRILQTGPALELLGRERIGRIQDGTYFTEEVPQSLIGMAEDVSKTGRFLLSSLAGEGKTRDELAELENSFDKRKENVRKQRFERIAADPESKDALARLKVLQEMMQEAQPVGVDLNSFKGIAGSVTEAMLGNVLPALGVGLVNPKAGWAVFTTQAFTDQFADSTVNRGRSLQESIGDAYFAAAAEAVPEAFVLKGILKEGSKIGKRVLTGIVGEGSQEILTESLNMGYEMGVFGDEVTLKEAVSRMIHAGVTGAVIGGQVAAATHPLVKMHEQRHKSGKIRGRQTNKNIDPDLTYVPGMNVTEAELKRADQIKELLQTYEGSTILNENATPEQADYLEGLRNELADIEARKDVVVDHEGQFVIPGVSLEDIKNSKLTLPHEPETAMEVESPDNEVQPVNLNDHLDFQGTRDKIAEFAGEVIPKLQSTPTRDTNLRSLMEDWYVMHRGESLEKIKEEATKHEWYQQRVRQVVDELWPDMDTIILYRGHEPSRAAFSPQEIKKWESGNGSISPGTAMQWARGKAANEGDPMDVSNAQVTVVEVPKDAIFSLTHEYPSEMEILFDTTRIKHRGYMKFLDYVNGLRAENAKDAETLEKLRKGNTDMESDVFIKSDRVMKQKLPMFYLDENNQIEVFGRQQLKPDEQDVEPRQLDFYGVLEESLLPEQQPFFFAEGEPIWLFTEGWSPVRGTQKGTQGGQVWRNKRTGAEYFIKTNTNPEVPQSEILASKLYREAGLRVPETLPVEGKGREKGVASRVAPTARHMKLEDVDTVPEILDGFIIDAWLGNRDSIGMDFDNMLVEETPWGPRALRVDFGGALEYRAQGERKGASFGDTVSELKTMRDAKMPHRTSVKVYGRLTDADLRKQAERLAAITPERIADIVEQWGPRDRAAREALTQKLINRRDDILRQYPPEKAQVPEQQAPRTEHKTPHATVKPLAQVFDKVFKKQRGSIILHNAHGEPVGTPVQMKKRMLLDMDKFSKWVDMTWTISQLVLKNTHIQGLLKYHETQQAMANTKMKWISRAEHRVREWQRLYKGQADALADFLFELNEMNYLKEKEQARHPTPEELGELVKEHKLMPQTLELYFRIRDDFLEVLDEVENAEIKMAEDTFTDQDVLNEKIKRIQASTRRLKARPYFPLSRFGDYLVTVRNDDGDVIYMEPFETETAQTAGYKRIKEEFPKGLIRRSKVTEKIQPFKNLPPHVKESVINLFDLDTPRDNAAEDAQRRKQLKDLEEILFEQSDPRAFKKHFEPRKMTPGYSKDAMRNYADYFFRGSSHLARVMHAADLDAAIREMKIERNELGKVPDVKTNKRDEMIRFVEDHRDYILNPENDWANLRALGFVWFLGFVPKSAAVNLTQIPFIGYPFLSAQFGDVKAAAALKDAMLDLRKIYQRKAEGNVSDAKLRGINLGIQRLFLEESQAMELAAMATSNVLQRALPGNKVQRGIRELQYASAWMFQEAEKINRRVMFSAAWDLSQRNPESEYLEELRQRNPLQYKELTEKMGWSKADATAYLAGKDAVDRTQYEYASWNRPRFMRGKKSVIFLFYMHLQNTLWFFGNSPGATRALLTLLAVAGLAGLPGYDDLTGMVEWMARRMGFHFDVDKEVRELLVELGSENPDVFLHGASRYSFGLGTVGDLTGLPIPNVDLGGSLSYGRVIPGLAELTAPGDFEHKFTRTTSGAGGAVTSGAMGIMQAVADTKNPDNWKRWERAMPMALKNISKAARRYVRAGEQTTNYATIVDYDPNDSEHMMELIFQAAGFPTTRVNQAWDRVRMQTEAEMFWAGKRQYLMKALSAAIEMDDKEGIKDAEAAINKHNNEVPFASLVVNGKDIQQSRRSAQRFRERAELGLGRSRRYDPLAEEIKGLHPEAEQDVTVEKIR